MSASPPDRSAGGWLLEHFSWGSIFLVNVPIAAVAIVGGMLFVPTSRDPATPPVDVPGLILSAVGVTALVYTVIEAPSWGWGSARTVAGFAMAAIVLAAFALWERRSSHPMLDVSVFANRRFSGGSLAVTAGFLTLFGFIFVITQYFQFIKSYSAFETGVRLLPVAVSIAVASVLGPRIVERVGTTAVVAAGLAMFAAGLAWASTADAATLLRRDRRADGAARWRPRPDDRAGHRSDHGLAQRRQGRGRLRGQRHHPRAGRHPRRRHRRQRLRIRVLRAPRLRVGACGAAGRCPLDDGQPQWPRAYKVIGQLPAVALPAVRDAVNHAFLDGLQIGSLVCAGIALAAAVVVAVLLPARGRHAPPPTATPELVEA